MSKKIEITERDREFMQRWAKHIGGIKTAKKSEAARKNGKLGGRPRKSSDNKATHEGLQ